MVHRIIKLKTSKRGIADVLSLILLHYRSKHDQNPERFIFVGQSLHICKTAFLLTLIAYSITIFTIDLLPFGFYLLVTHCPHLVQSHVCVNRDYFHFISKSCISALWFWKSQRAVCEEPEWVLVLLLPAVCVSNLSSPYTGTPQPNSSCLHLLFAAIYTESMGI